MSGTGLIKHVSGSDFNNTIGKGVTLVDFFANWCGPCRSLTPVLEQVAKEVLGKAVVVKLDIDSDQSIAAQFQIMSVPTMILFKDGKEVGRLVGLRTAADVHNFIQKAL